MSVLLTATALLGFASVFADPSYSEQCQWMGADDNHGPFLPVGVCKHIFDPHDLDNPFDDHRYSQKYVCGDDGTLLTQAWSNNSFCDGPPGYEAPAHVQGSEGDYFSCAAEETCPYAVIRFYDQQNATDADSCAKSSDGWYSEAPITVYQCLSQTNDNGTVEWYQMQCTADGRGLIGIDYTENCEERLNETVFFDGCNYKDKYIEIRHCDFWDGANAVIEAQTTTTTTSTTEGPSTSTSTTTAGTSTSLTKFLSTVSSMIDDGGHGHHGHHEHSHDGHDGHHGRGHGSEDWSSSSESEEGEAKWARLERLHPMLLFAVCALCVVLCTLCGCVSCKYLKQRKQIAQLAAMVDAQEGNSTVAGKKKVLVEETTTTVLLEEGETITIR